MVGALGHILGISRQLHAGVAVTRFRGDVDRDEASALDTIHRVTARLKDIVVNVRLGLEELDTAVGGGLGGADKGLCANKLKGFLQPQLSQAELKVVGGSRGRGRVLCVDIDVPLEAFEWLSKDMGLARRGEGASKLLIQELDLVVKGRVREVL